MTAVDIWKASRVETLELLAEQSRALDPDGRGAIAVCVVCEGTTRRNMQTGERKCDLHPGAGHRWTRYPEAA